jgi:hypothetical protein
MRITGILRGGAAQEFIDLRYSQLGQLGFELQDLLRKAIRFVPVVEVEKLEMAVSFHLDGSKIVEEDRPAAVVAEFDSFDAHKPSFLTGLFFVTRHSMESVAVPPYLLSS